MNRRHSPHPLLALLLLIACSPRPCAAQPNVIFIYADDLGFGDLACHGHPRIRTPHLDRLAREGTDFWSFTGEASAHDTTAASWISVAATDHALRFIREFNGGSFYLNLWLHETHHLVSATEDDKQPYADVPEPHRTYYAAVSRADRQVGRVLDLLDELGLAENTLVMFSSGNGPENSHDRLGQKFYSSQGSTGGLRGRKRSLLMGGINVPFLVRWPGVVPAGRVDKATALAGVDVFPTVLAAFKGHAQARTTPVFWWWRGNHGGDDWPAFAMRDGDHLLLLDEAQRRAELYDVVADRFQARGGVRRRGALIGLAAAA